MFMTYRQPSNLKRKSVEDAGLRVGTGSVAFGRKVIWWEVPEKWESVFYSKDRGMSGVGLLAGLLAPSLPFS